MPMNVVYRGPSDLPEVIPVFPLSGALLLPRGQMPLNIFEPRYLAMVDDAMADRHRLIGMIQPNPTVPGSEEKPALFAVGGVGLLTSVAWWWFVDNGSKNRAVVQSVNVAALPGGGAIFIGGNF